MALKTGTLKIVQASGSKITVDTEMSSTSTNPVQNKVIYEWVTKMFQGLDPIGTIHEYSAEDITVSLRAGYWRLKMTGGGGDNFRYGAEGPYPNTSTSGSGAAFDGYIFVKENTIASGRAGDVAQDSTLFGITCGAGGDAAGMKTPGVGGTYTQGTQPSSVEIYGIPTLASNGNTGLHKTWTKNIPGADSKLTNKYDTGETPEYGQGRGTDSVSNPTAGVYQAGQGYVRLEFLGTNPPS